jgi:hypothetical protein
MRHSRLLHALHVTLSRNLRLLAFDRSESHANTTHANDNERRDEHNVTQRKIEWLYRELESIRGIKLIARTIIVLFLFARRLRYSATR